MTITASPRNPVRGSRRTDTAVRAALLAGAPLAVLAVLTGRAILGPQLVLVLCLGILASVAATRRPHAALLGGLALVCVVPFYSGRFVTGSIGLTPMTAVCLVLLPAALVALPRVRLQLLDVAVAGLVLLRVLAYLLNYTGGVGASAAIVLGVALPYFVVRALSTGAGFPRQAAYALVVPAALLSAVGLQERAGVVNPFFRLAGEFQVAQWARPELRFGAVRAEASFGHPIAFGMFLAVALLLAVALALEAATLAGRLALLGAAALILPALAATLSRGPLLVAAVAVVGWLLLVGRRVDALRLVAAGAAVVVAVVATPVLGTVQTLVTQSSGDTRESRSAGYRLEILDVVGDPEQFGLLGRESRQAESVSGAVGARTGLKSLDSEYAVVFLGSGALALGALVLVAGGVASIALRSGLTPLDRAWAVALASSCLNLLTVALLTQQAELFWASVAITAGIGQRARA